MREVVAELSVIPLGVGLSLSDYIAACEQTLKEWNLKIQLHAEGTNIEGDLHTVLQAIEACIRKVHEMGSPRVVTSIKISSRTDKDENMQQRIASVEKKMK